MTLKNQITNDLSVFFNIDEFAEIIVYTNLNAIETSIPAMVSREDPVQEEYVRGNETATCEIEVKISDVPTPHYGETFTFDNVVWEFDPVLGVTKKTDDVLTIRLERRLS